jgi:hypothetical protein
MYGITINWLKLWYNCLCKCTFLVEAKRKCRP